MGGPIMLRWSQKAAAPFRCQLAVEEENQFAVEGWMERGRSEAAAVGASAANIDASLDMLSKEFALDRDDILRAIGEIRGADVSLGRGGDACPVPLSHQRSAVHKVGTMASHRCPVVHARTSLLQFEARRRPDNYDECDRAHPEIDTVRTEATNAGTAHAGTDVGAPSEEQV